ncbi:MULTISPECIES: metallophosphoesterase [Arenibacter]|uniref:metallophosphoesterase n=1 Tax=Arenibacter TaxID=178469 RepID=UPI0011209CCF|nr:MULTISPECIES: metallophosphoesterase [Arenibacter]
MFADYNSNPKKMCFFINGKHILSGWLVAVLLLFLMSGCVLENEDSPPKDTTDDDLAVGTDPVSFTVIGDVPYSEEQRDGLLELINKHNASDPSEFVVHVGDIKPGAVSCEEPIYKDVDSILRLFEAPTFIVLGDNEYNDCDNPAQGLEYWKKYFLHFNKNWTFKPEVTYQAARTENFSWTMEKVLFIGINLVGSNVHDAGEWQTRLTDNGNWVKKLMEEQQETVAAAVIFGHANIVEAGPEKFQVYTDAFRLASKSFGKPVLYVQGDGHIWYQNKPWPEKNITRLQIDGGIKAVKITVDLHKDSPFVFDRTFLD